MMAQKRSNPSKRNNILDNMFPFDSLVYQKDDVWVVLPTWAKSFLQIGDNLSLICNSKIRFTAALAVPNRAYASVFLASGIVCGRFRAFHEESDSDYYKKILSLPEGTPLIYREKNRKKYVIKKENMPVNGKIHIGIQLDEGITNTIKYVAPENVRQIEIVNKESVKLPNVQKGWQIPSPTKLICQLIGESRVWDFVLKSRLECVVIGSRNLIHQELETKIALPGKAGDMCEGCISDLMRVREVQSRGVGYRSSLISPLSRRNSELSRLISPFVVIFDGALSYLQWGECWRQYNQIVILDYTDRNFQDAVYQVNQQYLYRSDKQDRVKFPPLPSAIEMMFFTSDL